MKEFLFVGETRSKQAKYRGYHQEDGVSTAKFLFEALKKIGIVPKEQAFQNLWDDDGKLQGIVTTDLIIVAMGKTLRNKLTELGIEEEIQKSLICDNIVQVYKPHILQSDGAIEKI